MVTPRFGDLGGLWQRSLIVLPDGTRDTTTRVSWLQGPTLYADLRQPRSLPTLSDVTALNDLTLSDCAALAAQQGFAGRLGFDGRHFEWRRDIDFQPAAATADAGSLEWNADILVERGRDVEYVEHWHRNPAAATLPCATAMLRETGSNTTAFLVRVGASFMYCRDRGLSLPPLRSLSDGIAAAADIHAARALIDCEISFGSITPGGFQITASTLPFRVGRTLDQQVMPHSVVLRDLDPDGVAVARRWDVLETEGELHHLRT
jgi:hypothetical protein